MSQVTTQNRTYRNFTLSIKSARTKRNYLQGLEYFMRFLRIQKGDYDALLKQEPELIQSNIIDFTVFCRDTRQLSPGTVKSYVAAVHKFYDMNDVELKWKRINRYQGEFYRVLEDRAYTHEEISKMVDNASLRNKAIILLMAECNTSTRNKNLHHLANQICQWRYRNNYWRYTPTMPRLKES
jgi:hypothetical protein